MTERFSKFLKSKFTLEIWQGDKIIFQSGKDGVKGLVEFIDEYCTKLENLIIFDKIVGRGAALLIVFLKAKEVFTKIISESGKKVLEESNIEFHFKETVSNIMNKKGNDICPIEKLSFGKMPEAFYRILKMG